MSVHHYASDTCLREDEKNEWVHDEWIEEMGAEVMEKEMQSYEAIQNEYGGMERRPIQMSVVKKGMNHIVHGNESL